MKVSEAFPSSFLKAEDLNGKSVTLAIAGADMETLGQGAKKDTRLVLSFRGTDKKLVVNKTNANTIAKLYGDDTDGWIGQRITIMPREVEFQGNMVWAIRVSLQKPGVAPAKSAAPVAAVAEEEAPFPGDEECPI